MACCSCSRLTWLSRFLALGLPRKVELFLEELLELPSRLSRSISARCCSFSLIEGEVVAKIAPILDRDFFCLRLAALVGGRLIVVCAIEAAVDIRTAAGARVAAEDFLHKFEFLPTMMTISDFHGEPLAPIALCRYPAQIGIRQPSLFKGMLADRLTGLGTVPAIS